MTNTIHLTSSLFSLDGQIESNFTHIEFRIHPSLANTTTNIDTIPLLSKSIPTIFSAQCFNPHNRSFIQEVNSTPISHLFEHIFLEYLCISKETIKSQPFSFSANTSWNWHTDPPGLYRISVTAGFQDFIHIQFAIIKASQLLESILNQNSFPFPLQNAAVTRRIHAR